MFASVVLEEVNSAAQVRLEVALMQGNPAGFGVE